MSWTNDIDGPMRIHPLLDVVDEQWIEIGRRDLADRLLHDARAKRIGTPDLKHMLASAEHACHELVARKREKCSFRILIPGLVDHQSEARNAMLLFHVIEQ